MLSSSEKARYEWQMWIEGFGELGQEKLKNTKVLVSRAGGLGGLVAFQLAAAGVGTLIIAHAGDLKPSDLNRQLLMRHDGLDKPRIDSIRQTLMAFHPELHLKLVPENINEKNVQELVASADIIVDCAPLFEERFLMNEEAFKQGKPIVECAMYEMEVSITTMLRGKTPCLRCLYPEKPAAWKRQFPVLGAVSGMVACLAATEVVKWTTGIGTPLLNQLLVGDLNEMTFDKLPILKRENCSYC